MVNYFLAEVSQDSLFLISANPLETRKDMFEKTLDEMAYNLEFVQ